MARSHADAGRASAADPAHARWRLRERPEHALVYLTRCRTAITKTRRWRARRRYSGGRRQVPEQRRRAGPAVSRRPWQPTAKWRRACRQGRTPLLLRIAGDSVLHRARRRADRLRVSARAPPTFERKLDVAPSRGESRLAAMGSTACQSGTPHRYDESGRLVGMGCGRPLFET